MKWISMVALVLVTSLTTLTRAESASKAGCKLVFERSDVNNDQWLRGPEAREYIRAMKRAGIKRVSSDSKLNRSEFMRACEKGAFEN